jgi:hypothetical protein
MSEKYVEDNKKPSIFSRMAPAVISIGSLATAALVTTPGLADSFALTQTVDNDSQDSTAVINGKSTDLPPIPTQEADTSVAGDQVTPASADVSNTVDSTSGTQGSASDGVNTTASTGTALPATGSNEQVGVETGVVAEQPVLNEPAPVVVEPVPVEQPAANNSSSTWVQETPSSGGGSTGTVIDQADPSGTSSGNTSSPTPYYDDDDDDDHGDQYDDDDHDDDDDDHDDHDDDDDDDHDDDHDDDD